jgi:tyrosine-protein phosphatase YwqE
MGWGHPASSISTLTSSLRATTASKRSPEGLNLARDAFEHGTALLYATPHVSPALPLTEERERRIRKAFAELRERAPLELRLGFELTPMRAFLDEDPWRYVLEETEYVLVEIPFVGSADVFLEVGEWIERAGLTPVVAHPERTEAVLRNPDLADELAGRGWPLQVNASSLWAATARRWRARAGAWSTTGLRRSLPPTATGRRARCCWTAPYGLTTAPAWGRSGPLRCSTALRWASP